MVLADDLNNDGKMDLVVSTMNGNVYVFGSPARYHPLKSWTSQVRPSVWNQGPQSRMMYTLFMRP